MSASEATVVCACGQALVVPVGDLRAAFKCPRCGATRAVGDLLPHSTPLRAVPVTGAHTGQEAGTIGAPELGPSGTVVMHAIPVQNAGAPSAPGQQRVGTPMPSGVAPHTPPVVPTEPRAGQAWTGQASPPLAQVSAAKHAWSAAEWFSRTVGELAWQVDQRIARYRSAALFWAGVVVIFVRAIDFGYVWSFFVYSSFLYLLLVARLWWMRDDDGQWTWEFLWERAKVSASDLVHVFLPRETSWHQVCRKVSLVCSALGITLLVLVPPFAAVARAAFGVVGPVGHVDVTMTEGVLEIVGYCLLGGALAFWLLSWLRPSQPAKAFRSATSALFTERGGGAFPFAIDARQPNAAAVLPLSIKPLVEVLSKWKPRGQTIEAGYERSLVRLLERELPGVETRTQEPVRTADGGHGRIDVIVDNSLALELKRGLSGTETDRAVGQIAKYAEVWTGGPLILLLCEAPFGFENMGFVNRIGEIRRQGRPVFVVAAGGKPR